MVWDKSKAFEVGNMKDDLKSMRGTTVSKDFQGRPLVLCTRAFLETGTL